MNKALIYFDKGNEYASVGLLEVLKQIYQEGIYETYALCINEDVQEARGLFDYMIRLKQSSLKCYDILNITNCIEELHQREQFDCIIFPATCVGRMLAPRVAMRLKSGLVADVTGIHCRGDQIEMVRPAFDGKILAGIVSGSRPLMMSVRPGVFTCQTPTGKATVTQDFKPQKMSGSGVVELETREKEASCDIRDSEVLVSGGGGVSKDFARIGLLADELHGMVSASRRIVDSQIAPRSIQVGQSGKTVSPGLYIALGIYGSMQHIEGLKNVRHIIAVNTNRYAPFCSLADIIVEGDALEFVEKLVARIRRDRHTL